jgi:hypothetical protein
MLSDNIEGGCEPPERMTVVDRRRHLASHNTVVGKRQEEAWQQQGAS